MMKTSVGLDYFEDAGELGRRLGLLCDAGFDTFDLDLSHPSFRAILGDQSKCDRYIDGCLKQFEQKHVLVFQGHAPFPPHVSGDPEETEKNLRDIRLSIAVAGKLGIRYLIVHPICIQCDDPLYPDRDALLRMNVEMYRELVPLAAGYGTALCTENLFSHDADGKIRPGFSSSAQDLTDITDAVPGLGVCFDSGHAVLTGQDWEGMIRAFGPQLKTLHLHGNNGNLDLHVSPFEFSPIDWDRFAHILSEIGYEGTINLESFRFYEHTPEALLPDAFRYLHACAHYIASRIS